MSWIIEIAEKTSQMQQRRQWLQVGEGKGENGRDFDYVTDEWLVPMMTTRLRQEVDELDLKAVIRAINSL